MFKILAAFSLALSACASAPVPSPAPSAPAQAAQTAAKPTPVKLTQAQEFASWKADFTARALSKGYDRALATSVIASAKINPKAIERNKNQPEFSKPFWSYIDNVNSASRLNGGQSKLGEHKALFDSIEEHYGVDRHVLTAIWGLETAYGKIMGDDNMIDSLATLAFQGRRQKFGEQQLFAILDMLAAGDVRKQQLIGSWAGAMGMTQFIPTTFRDYAVDFDNNGNKDLWRNEGDALGSAAYYLKRFGWRPEEPIVTEVLLPKGFDYGLADGTKRTISGWSGLGVRGMAGKNWSNDALFLEAKLLIPTGAKGPVFLTFKNFDVIKKYNNSTSYALGITVLSESLQGKRTITTPWPRGDKPLTLTDKKNLQAALTRQGFDTKGVDGQIGPNSRRAIRTWQKTNGSPADGYVEQGLLKVILGN